MCKICYQIDYDKRAKFARDHNIPNYDPDWSKKQERIKIRKDPWTALFNKRNKSKQKSAKLPDVVSSTAASSAEFAVSMSTTTEVQSETSNNTATKDQEIAEGETSMADQQISPVSTTDEIQQDVAFAAESTIEATPLTFEIEVVVDAYHDDTADATYPQGENDQTVVDEAANSTTEAALEVNRIIDAVGAEAMNLQDEHEIMLEQAQTSQAAVAITINDETVGTSKMVSNAGIDEGQILGVSPTSDHEVDAEGGEVQVVQDASENLPLVDSTVILISTKDGEDRNSIIKMDESGTNFSYYELGTNGKYAGYSRMQHSFYNSIEGVLFSGFGFLCEFKSTDVWTVFFGDIFGEDGDLLRIFAGVIIVDPEKGSSFLLFFHLRRTEDGGLNYLSASYMLINNFFNQVTLGIISKPLYRLRCMNGSVFGSIIQIHFKNVRFKEVSQFFVCCGKICIYYNQLIQ